MDSLPAVHQFVPTVAAGDGVTHSALYTRRLLRQLGCESTLYSHRPPFELRGEVVDLHLFDGEHCDLLLVHHSMGHDLETWLARQPCRKVLVYHNITPPHYFAEGTEHHFFAVKGLDQLAAWRDGFDAAIGDSPLNSRALMELGYGNVTTLPLLVDFARFGGEAAPPPWRDWLRGRPVLLSVGRISPNKRQDLLVDALAWLKRLAPRDPCPLLVLAGSATDAAFDKRVRQRVRHWGLDTDVVVTGHIEEAQLQWLYRHATLYWCASEHEGFGMPLIEAGHYRLPTVAFASSSIPDTLGESGLLIEDSDPRALAAATRALLADEDLRRALGDGAARNLARFAEPRVQAGLEALLHRLGISGVDNHQL